MIKAIIIEDEPLAAERLQQLLIEVTELIQVEAHLSSVESAISYLHLHTPGLIFLDINLFDRYSFEIFDFVEVRSPIIFTTAYAKFAIKAFEQNSIDYLLKPISKEALAKSVAKFFNLKKQEALPFSAILGGEKSFREKFLVRQGSSLLVVQAREVAYFYSEDKITFIATRSGKRHVLENTLNDLEATLNPAHFFRINRRYIIHVEAIQHMAYLSKTKLKLTLAPGPESDAFVTVAIEKLGSFRRWLAG